MHLEEILSFQQRNLIIHWVHQNPLYTHPSWSNHYHLHLSYHLFRISDLEWNEAFQFFIFDIFQSDLDSFHFLILLREEVYKDFQESY